MTPRDRIAVMTPELRDAALLRWMEWLDRYINNPTQAEQDLKVTAQRQRELNAAS